MDQTPERAPEAGERILVFTPDWLRRIVVVRDKTLEIRGTGYKKKTFLLGCKGKIVARCDFGKPIHIKTVAQWNRLRSQHRVPGTKKLPYKKTFGLPVQRLTPFHSPYEYTAPRGAIGVVIYRGT